MPKKRTRHPNTLVFISALAIGIYLAALVGYAYFGQQRLRDSLQAQEQLLLARQASQIADYLDDQHAMLEELLETPSLLRYFVIRGRGAAEPAAAQTSRQAALETLQAALAIPGADGRSAFRRLRLTDPQGGVLIDAQPPPGAAAAGSNQTVALGFDVVRGKQGTFLRLDALAEINGIGLGHLLGEIDAAGALSAYIDSTTEGSTTSPAPHVALLDQRDRVVTAEPPGAWVHEQGQAPEAALRHAVGNHGLTLLKVAQSGGYHGLLTSPLFLGAMALIALPLLLAVSTLWRTNNHQLILRTRLQASRQQRERLRLQNDRLRDEIDRRVASEQELTHQANYDQLTGLPNRNLALDRLDQAIRWARREETNVLALFIDLDRFKQVNDSLGHAAGDELLREASRRLQACVRDRDTVSRLGGDEFFVICTGVEAAVDREHIARALLQTLAAPFFIDEHEFFVGGSIGMATYPDAGDSPHKLLKNADIAMYAAKQGGRNNYAQYEPSMDAEAMETVLLERNLRHALARNELSLMFQPIVDLVSGRTTAFEALLRWNNPELGQVPPTRFIPVAEETGLIHEIGEWVLQQACATLGAMTANTELRVAINLSSKQFSHPGRLLDCVLNALRNSGLMPEQLEIEITESILIDDRPEIAELINQLDRIGVRLSLDDFGTGYSALNYLQRFPFDVLKIDRSFTNQIPGSQANASLIRAIIAMAHALGLQVVAEGIETREQAGFLLVYHCEYGQGYLYSKPLSSEQLTQYLHADTTLSASA